MIKLESEVVKEEFDGEEFEMIQVIASTDHPSSEIRFFMNGNHMATTYTDNEGKAEVGTSNTKDSLVFQCFVGDEESDELHVN